jgi:hypothetical protein
VGRNSGELFSRFLLQRSTPFSHFGFWSGSH